MANSTLSVGGLATGIDTKSLVSQLMALERQPETLLTAQKTAAQKQIDAYNLLNTSLANFKTVMAGMNTSSTFQSMTASVADSTFMTAQASSSAASGVHTVTVNNLATFQRQVSDQIGFISEVGHSSGRRNGAPAECSVRKMAVLTVIADGLGRAEPRGLLRCLARAKHRGLLLVHVGRSLATSCWCFFGCARSEAGLVCLRPLERSESAPPVRAAPAFGGSRQRSGAVCKAGESGQGAGGTVPILATNFFGEASAL